MAFAMLIDLTRCVGCKGCVSACKEINELLPGNDEELRDVTWSVVQKHQGLYVRRQCMHCLDPACASVCPVSALKKTSSGPVTYDPEKCIGCRYCMVACPFGVPKYQWSEALPKVQKCIFCAEKRLARGLPPACASVCPSGATKFGERDSLLGEARQRIDSDPDHYVDHIYGQEEAGGTSWLYLSCVPFESLGFPTTVESDAYPKLTWQILNKIPNIVSTGGVLMFGLWWILNRRMQLQGQGEATDSDEKGGRP